MKVLVHATNKTLAGYLGIGPIGPDNYNDANLSKITEPIEEIFCDHSFCMFSTQQAQELLKTYYNRLCDGGKLTVIFDDVYMLAHQLHRRNMNEAEFNNHIFKGGAKNCASTKFFAEIGGMIGFKRMRTAFEGHACVMEFLK